MVLVFVLMYVGYTVLLYGVGVCVNVCWVYCVVRMVLVFVLMYVGYTVLLYGVGVCVNVCWVYCVVVWCWCLC